MKRCYACGIEIPADNRRAYRLEMDFSGNEALGGFGHRRSIGQNVCSSACLADVLESVAVDVRAVDASSGAKS